MLAAHAARLQPELVLLRRRLHRTPELGLDLPETHSTVLDALAGLELEVTTYDGFSGRGRGAPRHSTRAGGAAARRHGRVARHRGDGRRLRLRRPPHARLWARPAHGDARGRGAAAARSSGRDRGIGPLHVPARRRGISRRPAHDRRRPAHRGWGVAHCRVRVARRAGCDRSGCGGHASRSAAGVGRHVAGGGARGRRPRRSSPPRTRPGAGDRRDRHRAADGGDASVRRVRSGRRLGRCPRSGHGAQRDLRVGPTGGDDALVLGDGPRPARGSNHTGRAGDRRRAWPSRRSVGRTDVPGDGERPGGSCPVPPRRGRPLRDRSGRGARAPAPGSRGLLARARSGARRDGVPRGVRTRA